MLSMQGHVTRNHTFPKINHHTDKMKKLFFLILMAVASAALTGAGARTYALLAAVSNYGGEGDNQHTTTGAKAFRDVLKQQTNDITLLTSKNANAENILEKLRAITHRAQAGDRIIFFFNGHGFPGGLACHDSSLYYDKLVQTLTDTKASQVFVYINACFSGSATQEIGDDTNWFEGLKPHKGHVYMLSSRADEFSWSAGWLNKSFFTQALLTGYRGKADTNHDRYITVIELFKHIHKDVVRRSDGIQHPLLIAPREMHDEVVIRYSE